MQGDERLGGIATHLAVKFPEWIERRVEHVSYLDDDTTRWSVGVMLRWPEKEFFPPDIEPDDGELIYVPLDLLTKDPLVGLEGWHPDGSPFPILPASRSFALASAGITAAVWGRSVDEGKGGLSSQTIQILDATVRSASTIAPTLLTRALAESPEVAALLSTADKLHALIKQLSENMMFLAPAVYKAGHEHVYRYTYSQSQPREDPRRVRLGICMGFLDATTIHRRLGLGRSGSYHFEVDAPPELRIPRARLRGKYGPEQQTCLIAEASGSPTLDLYAFRPTTDAFTDGQAAAPTTRPPVLPQLAETASLNAAIEAADAARPTPVQPSDEGEAEVRFRLRPSGMFLATMIVSVVTALLLLAALTRLEQLDGQTAATLVLALPVVVLGYLNRPGEHSLATRLLTGVRAASVIVGICALLVAGILAGGFIHHKRLPPPNFSCSAHTAEQTTMNTHTHDPDGQEPLLAGLNCAAGKLPRETTTVNGSIKALAQATTWLAVFLSAMLLLGWLSTTFRSKKLLKPPKPAATG